MTKDDKDTLVLYGFNGQEKTKWLLGDFINYWNSRSHEKLFLTMRERNEAINENDSTLYCDVSDRFEVAR